eukprot:CAMPEP_0198729022 /NCGR_PEP_ID=MMETSP1475-20131203/13666_1 /TAXON_ID= ORGANISM="Unidentified sp., Strain CCMP1999" /NCGR_SAMPLE_ID=MMETSP1475 /ASSEMBLY_ACC=CAM_ASM_001111 /LENGTH=55 /DNA_ID=CAMNT_0044491551 /DNA_START=46 /DNA_END=213 /DNA_ORIENTATION=-
MTKAPQSESSYDLWSRTSQPLAVFSDAPQQCQKYDMAPPSLLSPGSDHLCFVSPL